MARRSRGQGIRRHILLANIKSDEYLHQIIGGVNRYAWHHGHWIVAPIQGLAALNAVLRSWRVDGLLIRGSDFLPAQHALFRLKQPIVEYDLRQAQPIFPCVSANHYASGRLAADYLLKRGFEHYVVSVMPHFADHEAARRGFLARLREAGKTCTDGTPPHVTRVTWSLERRVQFITRLLAKQPRPLAVLLGWDQPVFRYYDACDRLGLRIPEDVAFVGRGNQETLCESVWPSLTSVDLNAGEVGFQAAALLARLLEGAAPPAQPLLIPNGPIVERMSTDVLAVEDETIATALRLIRRHCLDPIGVEQLCRAVGLSRRTLESKFARIVGRTPAREMRRLRVAHAKRLLGNPDSKITQVALTCGYRDYADFCRNFEKETGLTPMAYRTQPPPAHS